MKPTPFAVRSFFLASASSVAFSRFSNSKDLNAVNVTSSHRTRERQYGQGYRSDPFQKEPEPLRNNEHYDFSEASKGNVREIDDDLEPCEPDQGILACRNEGEFCHQDDESDDEWYCFPSEDFGDAYFPSGYTMWEETGTEIDHHAIPETLANGLDTFHGEESSGSFIHYEEMIYRQLSPSTICPDPLPKVPRYYFDLLVYNCIKQKGYCEKEFENPSCWDTSDVVDMSWTFHGVYGSLVDVSNWDVGKVTNMNQMFGYSDFNGDISQWNVSSVREMGGMFPNSQFNGSISEWDVSSVTGMSYMFASSPFGGDVSKWKVGAVTNMNGMFENTEFNGDVSEWDVGNARYMRSMFRYSTFNGDVSKWDVGSVKDMRYMFGDASYFNGDVSNWNVGKVSDMEGMFEYSAFNGNISKWNVGKVTSMGIMFKSTKFNGDISEWNVGKVRKMFNLFSRSDFNGDISNWDVGKVTDMFAMFFNSKINRDLSNWDVGKVGEMAFMFQDIPSFNQNLGEWAFKVRSDIVTWTMFKNTSCPIQTDPEPGNPAWCQLVERPPSFSPSSSPSFFVDECTDQPVKFKNLKRKLKTCKKIAKIFADPDTTKKKKKKICRKKAKVGSIKKKVRDFCKETCGRVGFGPPGQDCNFSD